METVTLIDITIALKGEWNKRQVERLEGIIRRVLTVPEGKFISIWTTHFVTKEMEIIAPG